MTAIGEHKWTAEEVEKIKQMLIGGSSYREIAIAMLCDGSKRNQIAGVVNRNGLARLNSNSYNSRKRKPKPKAEPKARTSSGWHEARRISAMKKKIEIVKSSPPTMPVMEASTMLTEVVLDEAAYPKAVSFADIEDGQCKWPVQDQPRMFCGEATERDRPYCPFHRENGRSEPRAGAKKLWKTW